jgi:hypothetical protein
MARTRTRKRKNSMSAYFRQVFTDHPEWLKEKSNDLILQQYREDKGKNPDAPISVKVRNNLSNLKSVLRKEKGMGAYAGRKARSMAKTNSLGGSMIQRLEDLEEQIDECMVKANAIGVDMMEPVIRLLRKARREVVWKLG